MSYDFSKVISNAWPQTTQRAMEGSHCLCCNKCGFIVSTKNDIGFSSKVDEPMAGICCKDPDYRFVQTEFPGLGGGL